MFRGTTPTLKFALPFDTSTLAAAWVTLAQSGKVIVDRPLEDCVLSGNELSVTLTQEETIQLTAEHRVDIQLRVRTTDDTALASKVFTLTAERILKDGVI